MIATTSPQRSCLISSANLALSGTFGRGSMPLHHRPRATILIICRQIRQGIANNTKGTAFVVYEDVMDAKQACDKLNGFNFQNRYLVGRLNTLRPRIISITNRFSLIPPARQDGQVERGYRGSQGQFRAAQKTARYRITNRRAGGETSLAPST